MASMRGDFGELKDIAPPSDQGVGDNSKDAAEAIKDPGASGEGR